MRHERLLTTDRCMVLVIDMQEAFAKVIDGFDALVKKTCILVQAAALLDVPVIVSEQYPKGLGKTVEGLQEHLSNASVFEKVEFSCLQNADLAQAVHGQQRDQLLIAGVETHVCVAQTAADALAMDLQPSLLCDAVGCRHPFDGEIAISRLSQYGVAATTVEAAILEMAVTSRHPAFKQISALIK